MLEIGIRKLRHCCGRGTRTGYVLSALVPSRRTLLVSCNVVAISTKAVVSVGGSCRPILAIQKQS